MDTEDKIIKCSTCGDIMIAGMVNGKKLKNCRTCRGKRANRNLQSDTQEISHPPSEDEGEQPRVIPTCTPENHYSNMPLCKPDFLMTPPQTPQSVNQLLSTIHDNLTNRSSDTFANDMLNDLANSLNAIEHDTCITEFIEYQKKHNEETTKLLKMIYEAIG